MSEPSSDFIAKGKLPGVGEWVEGRYQLVRCIGEGGMGVVFEARHKFMDTAYALKFLQEEFAVQPQLSTRFLREARISGRIDNPHVVKVFDVNCEEDGLPYMVMELLSGETLHERYRRRDGNPIHDEEAYELMAQILDGVAAAHRLDVVHRDLKPANVMLTENDVGERVAKVLDFGLAKLLEGGASSGLTEPGTVLGTPDYMPPEQAFGQGVDQRADVFALGVMFFELLAGGRPVDGESPAEIASAYQHGRARRLEDAVPGVDPALALAIHKALAPKPEDRFDSAVAFQAAFARIAKPTRGARDEASPPSSGVLPPPAIAEPTRKSRAGLFVALALIALLIAGLVLWLS